ncbi:hypothetical protein C4E15_28135 [Achromobacter spanius]|uniref:Uncharacterized protein n=1 Tax=Achromobacter spanius TaxID=217203 RepID=A0A2S5GIS0_9BURK|nr:hypothetical protein [Achromobacter spanius]PPA72836.1 hypothetical protein C4E15_28135 [Achromobacter spanius]
MNQNNAAQPGQDPLFEAIDILTVAADELRHAHTLGDSFDDWTGEPEAKAEYDRTLRVVAALSKLRTEGVQAGDERAAFEAAWREVNSPLPMNTRRHDDGRYAIPDIEREWRLWQRRAALASAPVAGEAQPVAYMVGAELFNAHGPAMAYSKHVELPVVPLYSAPQASEAVRNALAELVRLQDAKDSQNHFPNPQRSKESAEYRRLWPDAMEAARAALSAQSSGNSGELAAQKHPRTDGGGRG